MTAVPRVPAAAPHTPTVTPRAPIAAPHVPIAGLALSTRSGEPIDSLVIPGLRRNPKRAHLWVSTVLGKHIPARPEAVLGAADRLGDLVRATLAGPDAVDSGAVDSGAVDSGRDVTPAVFGFAETATGLGHAVAHRIGADYLQSTRRPGAPVAMEFQEGHSHATDHLICPAGDFAPARSPLVLVDDELSTGATALDAIAAFERWRPRERYVVAALVDLRSDLDRERCARAAETLGVQLDWVALSDGAAEIDQDLAAWVATLPDPEPIPAPADPAPETLGKDLGTLRLGWTAAAPDGGRHGFRASEYPSFAEQVEALADAIAQAIPGDRPIIVIGHEELMYLPTRVAAALGATRDSWVQTTTRSPAYVLDRPGYPLRRGFRFPAPESCSDHGAAAADPSPRYLYNARVEGVDAALVLLGDGPADTAAWHGPDGAAAQLRAAGQDVLSVFIPAADVRVLERAR